MSSFLLIAPATVLLSQPLQPDPLLVASAWIERTLSGSAATAIAVTAVAASGITLMTGRTNPRQGILLPIGCFLLFGARSIAVSLLASLNVITPLQSPQAKEMASWQTSAEESKPILPQPYDAPFGADDLYP